MGLRGYDQTACLVAVAQVVAEGHSRDHRKYRNLTTERNHIDKNGEHEKDSKTKMLQMI